MTDAPATPSCRVPRTRHHHPHPGLPAQPQRPVRPPGRRTAPGARGRRGRRRHPRRRPHPHRRHVLRGRGPLRGHLGHGEGRPAGTGPAAPRPRGTAQTGRRPGHRTRPRRRPRPARRLRHLRGRTGHHLRVHRGPPRPRPRRHLAAAAAAARPRAAARYYLTGEKFGPAEAARIGLVTLAADDVDTGLAPVLDGLRKGSPQGLAESKKLVTAEVLAAFDRDTEALAEQSARLFGSAEAREGMTAFLERRAPAWAR